MLGARRCDYFEKGAQKVNMEAVKKAIMLLSYFKKNDFVFAVFDQNGMKCSEEADVQSLRTLQKELTEKKRSIKITDVDRYLKDMKKYLHDLTPEQMEFFQRVCILF